MFKPTMKSSRVNARNSVTLGDIDQYGNFVVNLTPVIAPMLQPVFYSPGVQCIGDMCKSVITGQRVVNPIQPSEVVIVGASALGAAALVHPIAALAVVGSWLVYRQATHSKVKSQTQGG